MRRLAAVTAMAAPAFVPGWAWGLQAQPCPASGGLNCRLQGYLTVLYVVAGVLAVTLVGVIAAAVLVYRKNKNKALGPE